VSLRYAVGSDVGSVRENNEDHVRVVPERGLFVVADGMGGHVAGEVASRVAVESFIEAVAKQPRPRRIKDEIAILEAAVHAANNAVMDTAQARGLIGMGTTLTAALIRGRTATIAHIGDSRAYLANDKLWMVTQDHTMAALMVQSGLLSEHDAAAHPERHVLTQAIGTGRTIEPDVFQTRLPRATRILLCSDGLYDVVPAIEILQLMQDPDLDATVPALIQAAKAHGGPDNITVVLIDP